MCIYITGVEQRSDIGQNPTKTVQCQPKLSDKVLIVFNVIKKCVIDCLHKHNF